MKSFLVSIALLPLTLFLTGEKTITLPDLVNPHKIIVEGNDIIIEDFPSIYVYSATDFNLKHRFGKEGEGPGEFLKRSGYVRLNISVNKKSIFVESNGRLTFFTRSGKTKRQLNSAASGYLFKPLSGSILVGHKNVSDSNTLHKTISLYQAENLKLKKTFYRLRHGTQPGRDIVLYDKSLRSWVDHSLIYIVSDFDFSIEVFGPEGNSLHRVTRKEYTPLKISEQDKKDTHSYLKIALAGYERIRDRLKFPEYFPAVRNVLFDDQTLYVTTFRRDQTGLECFVFSRAGTFIKKMKLPVSRENVFREYPYTINKGRIYQLVENSSHETWELYIRKML